MQYHRPCPVPRLCLGTIFAISLMVLEFAPRSAHCAPVYWVTDTPGDWNWRDTINWSSHPYLPGPMDDVTINVHDYVHITIFESHAIQSLELHNDLNICNNVSFCGGEARLTVLGNLQIHTPGKLTINPYGILARATVTGSGAIIYRNGVLENVTLGSGMVMKQFDTFGVGITIKNGLMLDGATIEIGRESGGDYSNGKVIFNGQGSALRGNGQVRFVSYPCVSCPAQGVGPNILAPKSGTSTLTIDPGIVIHAGVFNGHLTTGTVGLGEGTGGTVINGGTISAADSGCVIEVGPLHNDGIVHCAPGATVIAKRTYVQTSNGTLQLEIAGTQPGTYGVLKVDSTGTADVDAGILRATLVNGFIPEPCDTFAVVTALKPEPNVIFFRQVPPYSPWWHLVYRYDSTPSPGQWQQLVTLHLPCPPGEPTDISEMSPLASRAYQNDPNPFNPSTTIRFDLPEPGEVELSIFDINGRRVRQLVRVMRYDAGRHHVSWDGRDDRGIRLPSGVYLYRFDVGGYHATKKMLLVE